MSGLTQSGSAIRNAIAGLLTNRLVVSDVNGQTVLAGLTRITAFRPGVIGTNDKLCN